MKIILFILYFYKIYRKIDEIIRICSSTNNIIYIMYKTTK